MCEQNFKKKIAPQYNSNLLKCNKLAQAKQYSKPSLKNSQEENRDIKLVGSKHMETLISANLQSNIWLRIGWGQKNNLVEGKKIFRSNCENFTELLYLENIQAIDMKYKTR